MSRLVVGLVFGGLGSMAALVPAGCSSFGDGDDAQPAAVDGGVDAAVVDDAALSDSPSTPDADVPRISDVVTNVNAPFYLTVAGTELVFGSEGSPPGVFRVAKTGGAVQRIGTRPAFGIAVRGSDVFYCDRRADGGALMQVQMDGANEKNRTPNGDWCLEVAVSTAGVFFTTGARQSVEELEPNRIPMRSGGADFAPEGIKADESAVYYAGLHEHAVVTIPVGGSYEVLDPDRTKEPRRVAIDANNVYWVEHNSSEVRRVSKGGGDGFTISRGRTNTTNGGIAVDETHVYWVLGQNPGTLYRAPKSAKAEAPAEMLADGLGSPVDVALDDSFAYVTVRDENRIIRVKKK